jgi:hypothetical protein
MRTEMTSSFDFGAMVLADVLKVRRDETVVMYGLNAVLRLCMHKSRSKNNPAKIGKRDVDEIQK